MSVETNPQEPFIVDTIIIPDVENHYKIMSGKNRFTLADYMPFIDSHMHIQSNNCAPLTLQWALIREATAKFIDIQGADRKGLNVFAALIMNLGAVGRLGTDYIAKLFMNDMARFKIKEDLTWTFVFKSDLERFEKFRQEVEKKFGDRELEDFTKTEKEELEKIKIQYRMNADEQANQQINYIAGLMQKRDRDYKSLHEYGAYYFKQHKMFHMYVALPMDMSYAHYWGQSGLPIYLPFAEEDKMGFYFINEFCEIGMDIDERDRGFTRIDNVLTKNFNRIKVRLNYDLNIGKANESVGNLFVMDDKNLQEAGQRNKLAEIDKKKYKHFIEVVPGETDETFEDYRRQIKNTMIAGVLYPFEMLPFYHYDPRRHNRDQLDELLKVIKDNHVFLKAQKIYYHGEESIALKEMSIADNLKINLENKNLLNTEVFNNILPKTAVHSFFGIKMYPKLGYAPYDYDRYPQLKDFYAFCAENKIPITSHCSPGGMTIADAHVYLKEAKKNPYDMADKVMQRASEVTGQYDFKNKSINDIGECHRFINETCHHPRAWAKVLNDYDLKLCFAHFGGEEHWHKNQKENGEYWIDDIIEVIQSHNEVYTDLAYFVNKWHTIKKTAEKLAEKINSNAFLKNKILMGSDWYMFEREAFYSPGVDVYYRKMFEVLKMVSEKTGFDAWYYFAVGNPLKFLGFVEDGKDKMQDCARGMEKFKAHKSYIIEQLKDRNFKKDACIKNPDIISEKIDQFLGSDKEKLYPGCQNPVKYTGFVNLIDLKVLRDMKDDTGSDLLILKKPGAK